MKSVESQQQIEQLQQENSRLRRAVEELSILNDLAQEIGGAGDPTHIMQKIISRSLRAVNGEQGAITLVSENDKVGPHTLVRSIVSSDKHKPFHMNQAMLGWMLLNKQPLLIHNPESDDRFAGVEWEANIHTILCVPLLLKSNVSGILSVINKKHGEHFSNEDQRLLSIIATQSAQVIENARLTKDEQEFIRMQEQLRLAYDIQTSLLPTETPQIPGYEISGISIPAQTVGGDYYDFINIDDHRMAICLGDVSGKGLPAALLMANLQATIRSQALEGRNPDICLQKANMLLHQSTSAQKFATFFFGILDYQHHKFLYANAGHDRPILFSPHHKPKELSDAGIALSFQKQYEYQSYTVDVNPGDLLLFFSDGITEAMNEFEEEFEIDRVIEFTVRNINLAPSVLINLLIDEIKKHTGHQPQMDDMTIIILKRL